MFSQKVILWGGIASAFGGLMWLSIVLTAKGGDITFPLGFLLALGGVAALHARQGKQAGWLGWAGSILAIFGTVEVLSLFVWQGISGNSINPNSRLGLLLFGLGMPVLGIGSILIGLRALQIRILPRSTSMLSFVIGVCEIGLGFCVRLMYYLSPDPWNHMTTLAGVSLFLMFSIGTLWFALGATLAINPGLQTSNQAPASV